MKIIRPKFSSTGFEEQHYVFIFKAAFWSARDFTYNYIILYDMTKSHEREENRLLFRAIKLVINMELYREPA